MATLNKKKKVARKRATVTKVPLTHGGAVATTIDNPALQLRRLVMANMLWEDQFYIDGKSTAGLIQQVIPQVDPHEVAAIAVTAREKGKLRHVPLLLVRELARLKSQESKIEKMHKTPIVEWNRIPNGLVADTLARVIQRPDEMMEFLALYWKDGKQPLSAQVKKGLAAAFAKFNEYGFAKYDRDGDVKLRDVMFLTHPKPEKGSGALYKRIAERELKTPDTWEVALSAGKDKKETWIRLVEEKKLGGLAVLRNLRNMQEAGVPDGVIREAIRTMSTERVLPFRFISAAKYAAKFEPELENTMFRSLIGHGTLRGKTVLLVDNSGSMYSAISSKSDLQRVDAAVGLAMLLREVGEEVVIGSFADRTTLVPSRRGFALRDAIKKTPSGWTNIGEAVHWANREGGDRLIVLTDEQSQTQVPAPQFKYAYMVNVAAYQNGIGVQGQWDKVDGFSEAVVDYIMALEESGLNGVLR